MGLFKSSGPPNWSPGSLLLFQQLFPIWGFICCLKKYFSLVAVSRKQFGRLWGHDRPPPSLRRGDSPVALAHAPFASCLHGPPAGQRVLGL